MADESEIDNGSQKVEMIELEYGTDKDGTKQTLQIPKTFLDANGNQYDGQDILNKVNGKVKSVAEANIEKKYAQRIKELETIQKRTEGMITREQAQLLQDEIEELRIKQLPEKEQEIVRLNQQINRFKTEAENKAKYAEDSTSKYHNYRRSNEILSRLPKHGVVEQAMNHQSEIISKYGKFDENDNLVFENIFEEGGDPMGVEEFLESWYKDQNNFYALKASLVDGSGTEQGPRNLQGKEIYTGEQWQALVASKPLNEREELNRKRRNGDIIIKETH